MSSTKRYDEWMREKGALWCPRREPEIVMKAELLSPERRRWMAESNPKYLEELARTPAKEHE